MKFYTSDLHLDHKNIIKYESRPFPDIDQMNETIIANWNRRVSPSDEIYVLSDFAFCGGARANALLERLNGTKFLIKGNHDSFLKDRDFDKSKFSWIREYSHIDDGGKTVILFHYPIAVWDRKHYGSIHLYGHIHSNKGVHHPLVERLDNAFNVGVDVNEFMPKTLNELINT